LGSIPSVRERSKSDRETTSIACESDNAPAPRLGAFDALLTRMFDREVPIRSFDLQARKQALVRALAKLDLDDRGRSVIKLALNEVSCRLAAYA
jgi:hypothetical protein